MEMEEQCERQGPVHQGLFPTHLLSHPSTNHSTHLPAIPFINHPIHQPLIHPFYPSTYLFTNQSTTPFIHHSIHPLLHPSITPSIHHSIHPPLHLSTSFSSIPSIHLLLIHSIHPPLSHPLHPSLHLNIISMHSARVRFINLLHFQAFQTPKRQQYHVAARRVEGMEWLHGVVGGMRE